jgi:two-component system, NtrC family, sensor kinase
MLKVSLRAKFLFLAAAVLALVPAMTTALAAGGRAAVLGSVLGLVLMMALFFLLLQRRVLQPVSEVLRAAEEIRRGNLAARARVSGSDEMARLAHAFNFMADSFASGYAGLEQEVEERTGQLESLQEKLIQSARMSAVGQLVSGAAHELNNPLTAIIGFSQLQRLKLSKTAHPNQAMVKVLDDILGQAERCRRIVANLLQFARQREPHQEVVRINEIIEQVLQLREYEFTTRNISLLRVYDPTSPKLCADSCKLQQVFLNLLNNAHDAILETGRPGKIQVNTVAEESRVRIEISDDGAGFREPGRAFDPFYTTKDVGRGTGLGLSVCYGIVQEHGGTIRVENRNPGAAVIIQLPLDDQLARTGTD